MTPNDRTDRTRPATNCPDEVRLADAVDEYQALVRAGRRPDRSAFLARYPELAPDLAECLDGLSSEP